MASPFYHETPEYPARESDGGRRFGSAGAAP